MEKTKIMPSFASVIPCFLLVATMVLATLAGAAPHRYTVGDAQGWRLPDENNNVDIYEDWATQFTFYVGDSLVFQYKNDSVIRVDKRGYYHCNGTAAGGGPESTPKDGTKVFQLLQAGFDYYTSGDVEHCKRGMRLMVEVKGFWPSPSTASPSPSPLPSAAASTASTFSSISFALSLHLATMTMGSAALM